MAGPDFIETTCPTCSARLKLPAQQAGKQARCPKCQTVFAVPAGNAPSPASGFESMLDNLQPSSPPLGSNPYVSAPSPSSPAGNPYASNPAGVSPPGYGGNNPYMTNPYGQSNYTPPPPSSPLPIISMIAGIFCWLSCCCYFLGPPAALTAIITGHIALYQTAANRAFAYIGLVLGYLYAFVATTVIVVAVLSPRIQPPPPAAPVNQSNLELAEEFLDLSDDVDYYDGSSPEGMRLAEDFADTLVKAEAQIFDAEDLNRRRQEGVALAVWCEPGANKIAFLVSVPAYDGFNDEQKRQFSEVAWKIAHDLAHRSLRPGDEVALALRNADGEYVLIHIGRLGENAEDVGRIEYNGTDRQQLLPFFEAVSGFNAPNQVPDFPAEPIEKDSEPINAEDAPPGEKPQEVIESSDQPAVTSEPEPVPAASDGEVK